MFALLALLCGAAAAARPEAALGAVMRPSAAGTTSVAQAGPALPPAWGGSYEMIYELEMPYFLQLQPGGFRYRIHVWIDEAAESTRVDYNDGQQQSLFIKASRDKEYSIAPRKYKPSHCRIFDNSGKGPVQRLHAAAAAPTSGPLAAPALPDLSAAGWVSAGPSVVAGRAATLWQRRDVKGQKVSSYAFYVAADDGAPLRLHAVGTDILEGSHYDEYSFTFHSFARGPIHPKIFSVPSICNDTADDDASANTDSQNAEEAAAAALVLPGALPDADRVHYSAFAAAFGRAHDTAAQLAARLAAFSASKAKVATHNAGVAAGGPGAPKHTLALTHLADYTPDELERYATPRKWNRRHGRINLDSPRKPVGSFKATMTKEQLPRFFDWRGTPADVAVKDQAQCGSCWAFSATGSLEGAWYTHTGQSRSFSEQQLIDCAWDEGGHGCDGGDVRSAFDYVTAAGGAATTAAYPYAGLVGLCRDNTTAKEGIFDGFVRVDQDDESVMEALMRHGPLAIGIDADYDFGLYSEGVYYEHRCTTRPSRLNHAVVLVGWGEREGEGYWIVRNTWSSLWGQDGYILMARGGNDCGVASDAVFAKVADKFVVPGAQDSAMALGIARGRALQEQEERREEARRARAQGPERS